MGVAIGEWGVEGMVMHDFFNYFYHTLNEMNQL